MQFRGEQHLHPGHVQVGLEDIELVHHLLGVVEEGEGRRQVTPGERNGGAVVEDGGVLQALATGGEQLLATGVVLVGPGHGTERQGAYARWPYDRASQT